MEKNQPEKKFRAGNVTASVWKNSTMDANGKPRDFRSVSFEKSYKDKEGAWQKSNSLSSTDLPKAILVLTQAFEHIVQGKTAS